MAPTNKKDRLELLEDSETGNWNNAELYARMIVMGHILDLKKYEDIMDYGTIDFLEEFNFSVTDELKNLAKKKATIRYLNSLLKLIRDTIFALRTEDQKMVKEIRDNIESMKSGLNLCFSKVKDERERKEYVSINEEEFEKFSNMLKRLKEELLYPLNRADLIFNFIKDVDPKFAKMRLKSKLSEEA